MLYSSEYLAMILCRSGIWITVARIQYEALTTASTLYVMWSLHQTLYAFEYGAASGDF